MERDFLGLSFREPLSVVKEEIGRDACGDSGLNILSGMRGSFLNKVSAVPCLMSFEDAPDEKTKKVSEPIVSSGSMHIPVADAYDPSRRRTVVEVQGSFNHHRRGGSHFSLTSFPQQSHPQDVRMLPLSTRGIPTSLGDPFFKAHFAAIGQPLPGGMIRQKLPGDVLVSAPNSDHLAAGSTMGTDEPWKTIKPTLPSSQLTIFYAGTVNVYDDISPEKAQAIMFLARNGASVASETSQEKCFVQVPTRANMARNHVDLSQPTMQPFSILSSPVSVSSHPAPQSQGGPTGKDESKEGRAKGVGKPSKLDVPKAVNGMGSVAATTMVPSGTAIPQARKASLARFLEKRKERVMSSAPYNHINNSPEPSSPHSSVVNRSPALLATDKGSPH